ncbi:MAG TPA: glucosaminidase domain-containing protein [Alphaproteobacteria bacterium]
MKPASISAYGLTLCLLLAFLTPPGSQSDAARTSASERIAYTLSLAAAAAAPDDRGADWDKFTAAGKFKGLDVARAVGALGNSQRVVAAFEEMGYRLDLLREGYGTVPRVYLRALPSDLADVDSSDLRKALFIKSVLPPILRVNEEILARRAVLVGYSQRIDAGLPLSDAEIAAVDDMSALYDVKAANRAAVLHELLRRVDIVPPSLALTQAALESGWGTSRYAQEGNALFGQRAFNDTVESLVSRHTKPADVQRMRSFDSLLSAVRAYAHNLNSHPAYAEFRAQRADMRRKSNGGTPDGDALARTLLRYSERGLSYTADLRQLMRTNGMRKFDEAHLEPGGSNTQLASR